MAIEFSKLLSDKLIDCIFKLNEYDTRLAYKTINGKQCTIVWHINDLKISHIEKKVVKHIINKLNKILREYSFTKHMHGKEI